MTGDDAAAPVIRGCEPRDAALAFHRRLGYAAAEVIGLGERLIDHNPNENDRHA